MMKYLFLFGLIFIIGCSTLSERGRIEINSETGKKTYIPEEYMKITGQGSEAEYPNGYRIKSGKILPDIGQVPDIRR